MITRSHRVRMMIMAQSYIAPTSVCIITHADGSRGGTVLTGVCVFDARYLKNRCSYRIIKLDVETFQPP